GLLVVLTGTLPLAAAASMSEWGQSWWRKHLAWLTAWLLYKPSAALLYAAAFTLTDGKQRTAVEVMSGFMLLILSVLILPALLRVIVPMTASLGAASSGPLALAATGALATGAIKIAALRGRGQGPTGAEVSANATVPETSANSSSERQWSNPMATGSAADASGAARNTQPQSGGSAPQADTTRQPAGKETASPGTAEPRSGGTAPAPGTAEPRSGGTAPAPDSGIAAQAPEAGRPDARPSGSTTVGGSDRTGPAGPAGAGDQGDDTDREIGG
ncbi:MAG TPA: hypothetical protein VG123_08505, partial [Streptosporangiaceae bacterium]|nr:hypothetical protein [Streptosporangiaceae bacterium]